MKEQLEQRLEALKAEYEAGQKMLAELEAKQAALRDTLLRIAGAVQVLEEELGREDPPPDTAPVATSEDGTRFEVKARHLTPANNSLQSSAIRRLSDRHFDYLIGVVFEFDYRLRYALKVPYDTVRKRAEFRSHTNSHILHLKRDLLEEPGVEDITGLLVT